MRERHLWLAGSQECLPTFSSNVCFVFAPTQRDFMEDPHRDAMRAYLKDLNARYPKVPKRSGQRSRRPFVGEFAVHSAAEQMGSVFGSVFVFRNATEAVFFKLKFVG